MRMHAIALRVGARSGGGFAARRKPLQVLFWLQNGQPWRRGMQVPDQELVERVTGRRLDPVTGMIYPPEVQAAAAGHRRIASSSAA